MHGCRDSMEDAHLIDLNLGANSGIFGVFDGHAGKLCSAWLQENLTKYFQDVSKWNDAEAIKQACLNADEDFLTSPQFIDREDGSTAAFTLVKFNEETKEYEISVANIGDSRTNLSRLEDGTKFMIPCSEDHKPTDPIEHNRIVRAGGTVSMNRVEGQLALSRAFGDRVFKVPTAGDPALRKVCAAPDIRFEIAHSNDFLFIACDGIYESDICTRESIMKFIENEMNHTDDLAKICANVLDECLSRGSRDNMTAMIVMFSDGTSYDRDNEYIPGPYQGQPDKKFEEAYRLDAEAAGYTLEEALKLRSKIEEQMKNNLAQTTPSIDTPKEDASPSPDNNNDLPPLIALSPNPTETETSDNSTPENGTKLDETEEKSNSVDDNTNQVKEETQ